MAERPEIDQWILSSLSTLTAEVDRCYADYEPTLAGRAIQTFVCDNLSNWYVRLNRARYWRGESRPNGSNCSKGLEQTDDKLAAYQTLYTCLETVARLMAPIAPFYADRLYRDLRGDALSVHLADFPVAGATSPALERKMALAQQFTSLVLSIRKKVAIPVRQPLQAVLFPAVDAEQRADIMAVRDLVLAEVNVKELRIAESSDGVLVRRVKPNFRELGKRYGKLMKPLQTAIAALSQEQIAALEGNGSLRFDVEGNDVEITTADVEILSEDMPGWNVAAEGRVTVALDITVTDELKREGMARELVKRIQNYRKQAGFDITDRITVVVEPCGETDAAVAEYNDYIASQVLATSLTVGAVAADAAVLDMDGFTLRADIRKKP